MRHFPQGSGVRERLLRVYLLFWIGLESIIMDSKKHGRVSMFLAVRGEVLLWESPQEAVQPSLL